MKKAVKEPLRLRNNDLSKEHYGIFMEDDEIHDEPLTVVSKDYQLVQHEELLDSLESMIRKIDTSLERDVITANNGARMFARYNLPSIMEDVRQDDKVNMGILVTNSYDKSRSIQVRIYGNRISCWNVLSTDAHLSLMKTRHFKSSLNKFFDKQIPIFLSETNLRFIESINLWRKYNSYIGLENFSVKQEMIKVIKDLIPKKDFAIIAYEVATSTNLWDIYNSITRMWTHDWDIEKQLRFSNPINKIMQETLDSR